MQFRRRNLLFAGSSLFVQGARAAPTDTAVSFIGDGISQPPKSYAAVLTALAERPIAVDNYSREGVVAELETRMAALLGKEFAVFLPTGTMANHLSIRLLAGGGKVVVQQESHLYNDEGDCAQKLSGLNLVPFGVGKASFTLGEVEELATRAAGGRVDAPIGAISIESPVRRKSGEVFPFEEMKRISAYARKQGIGMHLDGARLFLASPYTGVSAAQYSAQFDTVYVSLYKYFNSTFGAILAGPRKQLENLYHARRMFGGGLPHVWPEAAVALHYLDGFEQRFAKAVQVSDAFLKALGNDERFTVGRIKPGSNIAMVRVGNADSGRLVARLAAQGITVARPRPNSPGEPVEIALTTNETILRRGADELATIFHRAV